MRLPSPRIVVHSFLIVLAISILFCLPILLGDSPVTVNAHLQKIAEGGSIDGPGYVIAMAQVLPVSGGCLLEGQQVDGRWVVVLPTDYAMDFLPTDQGIADRTTITDLNPDVEFILEECWGTIDLETFECTRNSDTLVDWGEKFRSPMPFPGDVDCQEQIDAIVPVIDRYTFNYMIKISWDGPIDTTGVDTNITEYPVDLVVFHFDD